MNLSLALGLLTRVVTDTERLTPWPEYFLYWHPSNLAAWMGQSSVYQGGICYSWKPTSLPNIVVGSARCRKLSLIPDIFQTLGFLETSWYGILISKLSWGLSLISWNVCVLLRHLPISTMSPMKYSDFFFKDIKMIQFCTIESKIADKALT